MLCRDKYVNTKKNFSSYFLSFSEGARLEIMHRADKSSRSLVRSQTFGLTHYSISVGNKENVNFLTEQIRKDGYTVAIEPRTTGDGYYESVVLDPEGNYIEIAE